MTRSLLVRGAKWDVERATFQFPGRPEVSREVIRHPGAVIILPVLGEGPRAEVVMIRNWRVSLERWIYELPAGTMTPGEDPAACAARELEEETGFRAATMTPLSRFHTAPGLGDEVMHAFVATGLTPTAQRPEADESMTVYPVTPERALAMISDGSLADAKSMLTLLLAERSGIFENLLRIRRSH